MLHPLRWLTAKFDASYRMWNPHESWRATALEMSALDPQHLAGANPCLACAPARCCHVMEAPLTPREIHSGLYQLQPVHWPHRPRFLARGPDGACIYLQHELCSIHPTRPAACRDYFCWNDGRACVSWPAH